MNKMQNRRRTAQRLMNIPIFLALVLFWLVAITTYMTSGLYARYTTSSKGSDSARVAQFGNLTLTETGDFGNGTTTAMIIPGVDLQKDAHVHFDGCEMSTAVFVEVIVSDHWSRSDHQFTAGTYMEWSVDSQWKYLISDTYDGKNRHIFYMVPGINKSLDADIVANDGRITVSPDLTEAVIGDLEGTRISFRASVIQTGGFENIMAAWNALAAK